MTNIEIRVNAEKRKKLIRECLRPGILLRSFLEESLAILLLLLPKSVVVKRIRRNIAEKVYGCSASDVFFYKSGRAALRGLMEAIKIRAPQRSVVFVPDYVCNVVGDACAAAGFTTQEYPTNEKYLPEWETLVKMVAGEAEPIVVLCSQFGAMPILEPEAEVLEKTNPYVFFVADECQNLIDNSPVSPRKNRAIVFSFNDKTCPGIMGGGVVISKDSQIDRPFFLQVEFSRRVVCSVALIRQWLLRIFNLFKQFIRLYPHRERHYGKPKFFDYSTCKRPHYDLAPEPIYKLSAARAWVSLRALPIYRQYRNDNAKSISACLEDLYFGNGTAAFQTAPPFLPVMARKGTSAKFLQVAKKAPYGKSPTHPLKSEHGYSLIINQPHLAYEVSEGFVSQLTSQHSIADNRILHCMARSADLAGYHSEVIGPAGENNTCGNIQLLACPIMKDKKRRSHFLRLCSLFMFALKSKCSLFQIHDPDLLPVGLALKLFRRRVIYDVHDDYEASFKDRLRGLPWLGRWIPKLWWWFERNAVRAFDGVIVADRHLAEKFAHCDPVILGNYPRIDFTSPANTEIEETFNLIYVGGVTKARGLEMALKALQLLPMPELRLHVIGAGQDAQLMEQLQAEARVVMHGRVPWTDLHKYYTRAHLGLALYQPLDSFMYCPGENAVKVLEYMAAGIPVLCSNFPGLKSFVEDAGCGMVVQPDDPERIALKIKEIFEDKLMREQLGSRGRHLFETRYNWEQNEHRLIQLYDRILGAC